MMGFLEIFDWCPGDILWLSSRYLMGALEILMGVLETFDGCPGDI